MRIIERLKKNRIIYSLGHCVNLSLIKLSVFPFTIKYLKADIIKITKNNSANPTKYLVYQNVGMTGLMTHVLAVLGWINYAEKNGLTLLVNTSSQENQYKVGNENPWELYFKQPMVDFNVISEWILNLQKNSNYAVCPANVRYNYIYNRHVPRWVIDRFPPTISFPQTDDFLKDEKKQRYYEELWKKYISFNPETEKYIQRELQEIIGTKGRVLGVLVRGTDYVSKRPYMHQIQPELKDVICKINEYKELYGWDYIYLATEDMSYDSALRKHYGDRILTNKREYVNSPSDISEIKKHDAGLQYLSSMYILSKCTMLIAGQCGGAQAALLMNQHQYEHVYLFDIGVYL